MHRSLIPVLLFVWSGCVLSAPQKPTHTSMLPNGTPSVTLAAPEFELREKATSGEPEIRIWLGAAKGFGPTERVQMTVKRDEATIATLGVLSKTQVFPLNTPGVYTFSFAGEVDNLPARLNVFVADLPAAGKRVRKAYRLTDITLNRSRLVVPLWWSEDQARAVYVEWRKGQSVVSRSGISAPYRVRNHGLRESVNRGLFPLGVQRGSVSFEVPPDVMMSSGQWEVHLLTTGTGALRLPFTVEAGAAPIVGKAEPLTPDPSSLQALEQYTKQVDLRTQNKPYRLQDAEIRALTRSQELLEKRRKLDQLLNVNNVESAPISRQLGESEAAFKRRNDNHSGDTGRLVVEVELKRKPEVQALWKSMQPLIEAYGGPWTTSELPPGYVPQ